MWTVPGAEMRHIANTSLGVRDKTLGLILHVQVGYGMLTDWYDNPSSQASSAWQAMRSGTVYQFGDPDVDKFWTQAAGNPDYGAVETEGFPEDPLTDAQIDACARIYAAGHIHEGWPFRLAEKPGERGLGWHGMGGAAWGNHPFCPGALRRAQRPEILARARALVEGEQDMTTDDSVRKIVREELRNALRVELTDFQREQIGTGMQAWPASKVLGYLGGQTAATRKFEQAAAAGDSAQAKVLADVAEDVQAIEASIAREEQ